jgi:Phosphotransferase enzyme family
MSTAFPEPRVLAWVHHALRGEQVIAAAHLPGGYTHENVAITTGSGSYVLRRYRRDSGIGSAARVCAIEVALARRLGSTAVPMAEVIAADETGAAAGTRIGPIEETEFQGPAAEVLPIKWVIGGHFRFQKGRVVINNG